METHSVLLIGGGGREHALAWALARSPHLGALHIAPGNPGTAQLGTNADLDIDDHEAVLDYIESHGIDLVVVGPEQPLVDGLTDYLEDYGVKVFGPSKAAAQLEGSKAFAKALMRKYGIPTADYAVFDRHELAALTGHIETRTDWPMVLKADGLAAGKGVFICQDAAEALMRVETILNDPGLSAAADLFVVEECMTGEEVSVFALCDGHQARILGWAQDHKRVGEGDTGLNTGGMGAYAPAPILDAAALEHIRLQIVQPTLDAMAGEGTPFRGMLYCGLMMTPAGPKVVEYNCRFGDPECQVLMPLLETDLIEIMLACVHGRLEHQPVDMRTGYACSVVLASGGYPGAYAKGHPITGLGEDTPDSVVFHSGTRRTEDGTLVTNGGRVLNVVGLGNTLPDAIAAAYARVSGIRFQDMYHRRDIGTKGLARLGLRT